MKHIRIFLLAIILACLCSTAAVAVEQPVNPICVYYFTGIGCPHCANVDPVICGEWLDEYPDLVVVEYELYQHAQNGPVFSAYADQFGMSRGVPNLLFGINASVSGDSPILSALPTLMAERENITAQYGNVLFGLEQCPIASLYGEPQVWHGDRILIRNGTGMQDGTFLYQLLFADDLNEVLSGADYEEINATPVPLSGSSVEFEHAVAMDGWVLQWNGEPLAEPTAAAAAAESPLPAWLALAAVGAVCLGYARLKR